MSIEVLNTENFDEKVIKADKPVIVDFYADWCGPCKMIAPVLEEISAENPDIYVYKVNIDDDGTLAERFAVKSIPNLISFKDGEVHKRIVGAQGKANLLDLAK